MTGASPVMSIADEEEGTRNCASLYGNIFYGACLS